MAQNTSSAVMQQRREPDDSLDDFPTPPWATRALVEHVLGAHGWRGSTVWEPAANRGHMARPLAEYFGTVHASDVHDYGVGYRVADFVFPFCEPAEIAEHGVDWIITNPPFRLAHTFVERMFQMKPRRGFAILVRTAFLEGVGRYEGLFRDRPPAIVAQFTERVVMVKGRLEAEGSTATAYCWLVWMISGETGGCRMRWIPPCRKRLERAGDYPAAPVSPRRCETNVVGAAGECLACCEAEQGERCRLALMQSDLLGVK